MRRIAWGWTWRVMVGASLWAGAASAAVPAPKGTPGRAEAVLVLSQLPESYDRAVMATLQRELPGEADGSGPAIERVAIPPDIEDPARLKALVKKALRERAWRLVVSTSSQIAQLVTQTGTRTPHLFRSAAHPVNSCLVRSMRHPGVPATGYTSATFSEGKMAETLQLAYPGITQVVMLMDGRPEPGEDDCPSPVPMPPCKPGFVDAAAEREALLRNASSLRDVLRAGQPPHPPLRLLRLCEAEDLAQLPRWLPATPGARPRTAVVVPYQQLFYEEGPALIAQLQHLRLPAIYGSRNFMPMGALMAMAAVAEPPGEARGIELAGRILAGEPPAEIPVQRPEGVELILNVSVARKLGLPPSKAVLRAADRLVR